MSDRFTIKRGDARPLTITANADLTTAILRFLLRTRPNVAPAVVITPTGATVAAGVTTATVNFTTAHTATAGMWFAELEATQGGVVQTFPSDGYVRVVVTDDLG